MRRHFQQTIYLFLFATALTVGLFGQDFKPATGANAKQFVGHWESRFQGKVFLILSLTGDANKLSGSLSNADFEVNDAGELTKAQINEGSTPITSAQVNGNRLRITTKSSDGSEESIDSEIVLQSPDEAQFHIIVPPDVPRPKPWKLTRVAGK
jgi:hypothetical protein